MGRGAPMPGCDLWSVGLVDCVQGRKFDACAPRLPRFILLVSFSDSDTLLVVSIQAVLKGLLIVPVGTMGLC